MLDSTVELIAQATSNLHFIFCFCNVIIVFLLIDRYKSDLNHTPCSNDSLQIAVRNDYDNYVKAVEDDHITEESSSEIAKPNQYDEIDTEDERLEDDTEEDDDDYDYDYYEEAEHDDVELKTRIEEFINKIHREWQAERLREAAKFSNKLYTFSAM